MNTIEEIDAALQRLRVQHASAKRRERMKITRDIDTLLDKRLLLTSP